MLALNLLFVTAVGELDTRDNSAVHKSMFRAPDYSFEYGATKFILVNTNLALSIPSKQFPIRAGLFASLDLSLLLKI